MVKVIRGKLAFLLAVVFATVVGSVGTAVVMAAIPSGNGMINGCYGKFAGNLRVIDAEAGKVCTNFENPISWSASGSGSVGGAQIAHAAFNPDGTLDGGYSENILEAKIVRNVVSPTDWPNGYDAACFKVTFEPREAEAAYGGDNVVLLSHKNVAGGTLNPQDLIEDHCGADYNAVFFTNPEGPAVETYTFTFLR